ncbi:DUF3558 family protein [Streptomyces sp. TRM 70351]|uniref:DUF3558 family protein n=1 Tax=Streptomyces sp. TRM 70351 TaxID=3116552 RepID=UPI002E7C0C2D|nr:DUF3558 family protein [Streptomyces sp. TRM 70351]MEE1931505.1 DUF3558 family protein [Streptomyces sp. TRM 70351]
MLRKHRPTSRRATVRRTLAAAAVPVLFVAGCSGGGSDDKSGASPSPSASSASPEPEPVTFTTLPDACEALPEKTVEEVVPKTRDAGGKALKSKDTASYSGCLWTGLDEYDYRSLSVSLRRFDSDLTLGSGDERAAEYAGEQIADVGADKANKNVKDAPLEGVGDAATSIGYDTEVKEGDSAGDYRARRVVARTANVVVTVDYSGTGFEDGETPSAGAVQKGAETAAKAAVAAVK